MINFIRFVLLCLMASSAFAQSSLPACQGSDVSRWTNCFGFLSYSSTEKYSGEFIDGQRHGMGAFTFFGGWKYVGEFRNYKRNGHGIYYKPDGSISATGNWSDDKLVNSFALDANRFPFNQPTQTASAQTSNPEKVQLTAAAQSQLPVCYFPVGQKWTDCFGTQIFSNGSMYVGEFKDGSFNGQGLEYYPNGSISKQGRWENGNLVQSFTVDAQRFPFNPPAQTAQPSTAERVQLAAAAQSQLPACQGSEERWTNCLGTLNLANGNKFDGEFKNGKLTGQGTYTFTNGDKYVGEFISFAANGQGIEYNSSGSITRQGRWENNRLVQSFSVDAQRFPFNSSLTASATLAPAPDPVKAERDRLTAEIEAERGKRQELEQQLASSKERERITAELDAERRKRQELQAELDRAKEIAESRLADQQRPQAVQRTERRVALVIGNAQYKSSPLENSVNDATDIDQALKRFGFQTTFLRNASLSQMRESTRRFADQLTTADVALIYFAGHGIESKNKNFMIPVNADLKFEYELADQAYDAGAWLEMLEMIKSNNAERVNIVILDACRNNNLIGSRSLNRGLGRMDAPAGTFLSYSTAPGKVAADGGKGERNSPFTRNLLKAIQQPGQPIEEVFKEVRRNVTRETNGAQVPWESTSLTGFFSFRQTR